jgi:hypothetical protein
MASDANTSVTLPIGWIGTDFSSIHRMYAFLLVKTNEITSPSVTHSHTWKPSAPGSTPTGWTPLNLTYGGRNWVVLFRFLAPKGLKAPRHTRLLQAQLINEINIGKRLNMSTIVGGYNYNYICIRDQVLLTGDNNENPDISCLYSCWG